ncbi:hypothetical protein FUAX_27530 [Fulvitalea axinellae]|uniref:Zinc ribbon domain-containing protein n=1 Tax=Fulvitalea axinellae TaxID=1182444 RepID=A0AAU9CMN1_9BACT|nr:hypothetical protein FUAX_27530 [Fulvitalea axinellae]
MLICKNCDTEAKENDLVCGTCNYPVRGNEKEQAKFIAKQVTEKADVETAFQRLKHARNALFVLGAYFAVVTWFTGSDIIGMTIGYFIALVFVVFGVLTLKMPKMAMLVPLCLILVKEIIHLFVSPETFLDGIGLRYAIPAILAVGFYSVRKAELILSNNTYLASQLGYSKVR